MKQIIYKVYREIEKDWVVPFAAVYDDGTFKYIGNNVGLQESHESSWRSELETVNKYWETPPQLHATAGGRDNKRYPEAFKSLVAIVRYSPPWNPDSEYKVEYLGEGDPWDSPAPRKPGIIY